MKLLYGIWIGALYLLLSLFIGEQHPFTRVPMYSSFPNYAYSFYLSDSANNLLPLATYYHLADDELSHHYSSICEGKKNPYGNQIETAEQLQSVGKLMFEKLKPYQYASLSTEKMRLHRVCYYLSENKIRQTDIVLFETNIDE